MMKINRHHYIESYTADLRYHLSKSGYFGKNELLEITTDFSNKLLESLPSQIDLSDVEDLTSPEMTASDIISELDERRIKVNYRDYRRIIKLALQVFVVVNFLLYLSWMMTYVLPRTWQITSLMIDRPFTFLVIGALYYGTLLLLLPAVSSRYNLDLAPSLHISRVFSALFMLPVILNFLFSLFIFVDLAFFFEGKTFLMSMYDVIQIILSLSLSAMILQKGWAMQAQLFAPPAKLFFTRQFKYFQSAEAFSQLIQVLVLVYLGTVLFGMDFNQTSYLAILLLGAVLTIQVFQRGNTGYALAITLINLTQLINFIPQLSVMSFELREAYLTQYYNSFGISRYDIYVYGRNLDIWWAALILGTSLVLLFMEVSAPQIKKRLSALRGKDFKTPLLLLMVLLLLANPAFYPDHSTTIDFEVTQGWRGGITVDNTILYASAVPLSITQAGSMSYQIYVNSEVYQKEAPMLFYLQHAQNSAPSNISMNVSLAAVLPVPDTGMETRLTASRGSNEIVDEFRSVVSGVLEVERNDTVVFYLAVDGDDLYGDIGWLHIVFSPQFNPVKLLYLVNSLAVLWLLLPARKKQDVNK